MQISMKQVRLDEAVLGLKSICFNLCSVGTVLEKITIILKKINKKKINKNHNTTRVRTTRHFFWL